MLVAAALIPSAPSLLAEVTPVLPPELEELRSAVSEVLDGLPERDVTVLVASADASGVHASARADLTVIGRPDVTGDLPVPARAARSATETTGLARLRGPLPLDLAVLALHGDRAVLPVAVRGDVDGPTLAGVGRGIVAGLEEAGLRAVMIAAGDGSAGLGRVAPRPGLEGAEEWQRAYEAAIGNVDALTRLGPAEATRVAARGWAPAVVVAGAIAASGAGDLCVTAAAAPRGVGYVVASTA